MTIQELYASLKAKTDEMEKLVAENPDTMDDETAAKFDAMEAEAVAIKAQIDRAKKLEEMKSHAAAVPAGRKTAPEAKVPARPKQEDDTSGFEGLGEFASCVRSACMQGGVDQRLQIMGAPGNPHREGGSSDGYQVPAQFSNSIFELMFSEPDLLSMVDSEPTSSNSVRMLADETTPWGSTGIQAYWSGENKKMTPSRLDTIGKEVQLHKLYAFVEATEELLEDAPRLNARMTSGAARAMNWKSNTAVLFGNGIGMPLGFDSVASKITVAKEGSQAADTIVAANIAKMYSRVVDPSQAVWMINQDALPQLMTMTLGNNLIWTPPTSGFSMAPGGTLLGRPVLFSDQCSTVGDNGDIMLVNPKGYYMPKKSGIKFSSSIHLFFDYDVQAFKWTFRLGGMPYLQTAITPNKGSNTRSHFVTLADRA